MSESDAQHLVSPEATAASLEEARVAESSAHDRTTRAMMNHLVALIRDAFPAAVGLTIGFPRLESDGRWDTVLVSVWAEASESPESADVGGPSCAKVLYDHETGRNAHQPDAGRDWSSTLTEIERLLTELAAEGSLYDWDYVDESGSQRHRELSKLQPGALS